MKYYIVTPIKNEGKYIRHTLDSVINQTKTPEKWIIVDDGSTDDTLNIIKDYEKRISWIKVIENKNFNEQRRGGAKVIRAFNKGYKEIKTRDYDFIVKLDGDLKLPSNYFEEICNVFIKNPKVGLCGGVILNKYGDKLIQEGKINYHVRGAFKSIRKECFEQIGGFKELWNWDGIDEMDAMLKGWQTKVIDLKVIHYRPTSSAYNFRKQNLMHGRDAYALRNNVILLLLRTIKAMTKKPLIIGGFYYLTGYLQGLINQDKPTVSKELSKFMNKFHTKRILLNK